MESQAERESAMTRAELIEQLNWGARELSTATVMIHSAIAEHFGLSANDWKCGEFVNRQGALTAGQLAELTGLTTGAITGVIDRLEKARFVRRVTDPNDRRKVVVEWIPDRDAEVAQLLGEAFGEIGERMNQYSNEQLRLIYDFMHGNAQLVIATAIRLRKEQR